MNAEIACVFLFCLIALFGLIGAIMTDPEFVTVIVGQQATINVPFPELNSVMIVLDASEPTA